MFGFRDVEIVHAVVRAGGFRAAAQRLGLAQSAISARIAALEKRLGVRLFDRVGRQVRLSPAGRRFLEEADRLVHSRDRIVQEITQTSGLNGTVRIGVAETIVHTILTAMLKRLRREHAHVRFELSVDTSEQLANKLVEDEIDVAILLRDLQPRDVVAAPLRPIALGWYASDRLPRPAAPLTLAELAAHPIVTFPKGTPPYKQVERLFTGSVGDAPILHGSASLSTVLHLVADQFGIGVLPCRMATSHQLGAADHIQQLEVEPCAAPEDLNFVVAYFPERNREAGRIISEAALEADQNDLL
ncbi:LysR family transcriptional regulator [Chelativorans alearense]|uniref:LysR family transcriptional regulator n=1 Tax=Chelativorans alearense TaxID=2681495 RepID=UPI0013D46DCA|nr:LysR family transcriptional regulator [Chelativorans alearense]